MSNEEYLTYAAAGRLLGVSRVTIHDWVRKGRLIAHDVREVEFDPVRPGSLRHVIKRADVDALAARRKAVAR